MTGKLESLATTLHNKFCSLDHNDQCAWGYEESYWFRWQRDYDSVWDAPTHKRWLKQAIEVLHED